MKFVYKWIEGRSNLEEYCLKRFKDKPHFVETIGRVGYEGAKIRLIYKCRMDGGYAEMYLLYMPSEKGTIQWIDEIERMSYEEIRADRTAILR